MSIVCVCENASAAKTFTSTHDSLLYCSNFFTNFEVYRHVIILTLDDCKKLFVQFVKAGFAVLFTAFIVQISLQIFKC